MFRRITLLLPFLSFFLLSSTQALPTDDCPILGPSFPSNFDPSSTTVIRELQSRFPAQLESLLSSGVINRTHTSFSINVFSAVTNSSIFSYHHAAPGLNGSLTAGVLNDDTLYRIGSVSKLLSVYAILVKAGMEIFDHPVTRYLPELAGNAGSDPLERISWEEVTVGALASQLAGTGGMQFLTLMRTRKRPVAPPFETALYSDAGFGILGRVLERLTGLPYADAVQSILFAPLGLNGTSARQPPSEGLNAVVLPGGFQESSWGFDNQITAPSGGLYSNTADLRTTGLSILHSTLLPPRTTRAWLKPQSQTASLITTVGAPWEINRLALPVSPTSPRTRISDLYTKLGGQTGYAAVFALSPDHALGFSVLIAGPRAGRARFPLRDAVGEAWVTAAEHAAAENAARNFAGTFVDPSVDGANLTLTVQRDRPGLGLEAWFVRGVDWRANLTGPAAALPVANLSVRLYPTGLVTLSPSSPSVNASADAAQLSFRAIPLSLPPGPRAAVEGGQGLFDHGCQSWVSVDFWSVDGYGIDEFVFEVVGGRLESVRSLGAGTRMRRID